MYISLRQATHSTPSMYKPKPTTPSSCHNDKQEDVTGMNSALAKLHPLIPRGIVCFIQAGYEDTFCFV